MNTIQTLLKAIDNKMPNKLFKEIKNISNTKFNISSEMCIKNHNLIMYYVVDHNNTFIRAMIASKLTDPGIDILLIHMDNYLCINSAQLNVEFDINFVVRSLCKGDNNCVVCFDNFINTLSAGTCFKCNSSVCNKCYVKIVNELFYKCPVCRTLQPIKIGYADINDN